MINFSKLFIQIFFTFAFFMIGVGAARGQTLTLTQPDSGAVVRANTAFTWTLPPDYTKVTFFTKSLNPDGSERIDSVVLPDGSTSVQDVTTGRNVLFFHRGKQAQWWVRACHKDNPSNCIQPASSRSIKIALMGLYLNKYYFSGGNLLQNTSWNNQIQPLIDAQMNGRRVAFRFFNTGSESSGAQAYKIELTGGGATISYLIPAADRVQGDINPDNSESYDVFDLNLNLVGRATYQAGYYTFEPSSDLPANMNQDIDGDSKVEVYWNIAACRQIPDGGALECGGPVTDFQIRKFLMPVSSGLGALPGPGFADPGVDLLETFQHPRCLECHNMSKPGQKDNTATVTYRHLSRVSGINSNSTDAQIATAFSNTANCVGCHQATHLTDLLPADYETDPWAWFSPLFEGNLTWPDLILSDPQAACEMIKQSVGNNSETMRHHLKQDPRVIWAFSGKTPGVSKDPAPPYDTDGQGDANAKFAAALEEWESRVDAWIDGGMNCASVLSYGSAASGSGSTPNVDLSSDTIAPNTTVNIPGGIYHSPKTILLICDDGEGSGCDKSYYHISSKPCAEVQASEVNFQTYSGVVTIDQEGVNCLQYYSRDKAPNTLQRIQVSNNFLLSRTDRISEVEKLELATLTSGNKEAPIRQEYILDFGKPVTVATLLPTSDPSLVQVKLECSDGNGSGCLLTRFRVDGNIGDPFYSIYQEPVVIDRAQAHKVYYYSQDRALNPENRKTLEVASLEQGGPIQQPEPQPVTEGEEVAEEPAPGQEQGQEGDNKATDKEGGKVQEKEPQGKTQDQGVPQKPAGGCRLIK